MSRCCITGAVPLEETPRPVATVAVQFQVSDTLVRRARAAGYTNLSELAQDLLDNALERIEAADRATNPGEHVSRPRPSKLRNIPDENDFGGWPAVRPQPEERAS